MEIIKMLKAKRENKKKDSLTTVQSKNNSKLTNRMEDKSVVLSINLDNKQKKNWIRVLK